MYTVYQHWDPLKVCMVGKSYPPEFYSWIKNPKTRAVFERIAQETEEDYQSLIKILERFGVEIIRPDIPEDSSLLFDNNTNSYIPPPMTPRDYTGMFGNTFHTNNATSINEFYHNIKDESWPDEVYTIGDLKSLPERILNEICDVHDLNLRSFINLLPSDHTTIKIDFYEDALKHISDNCKINYSTMPLNGAGVTRVGKDLYMADKLEDLHKDTLQNYRITTLGLVAGSHSDGIFCPVVPGLIISLNDIPTYKDTFPGWEVVYLPDQSWSKVKPFMDLKEKNLGKWWIPGEEYNDDVIETVDTWLNKWVGYVEETVFDVNMLVIDEQNVVVNNYNKQVFDALERYGVTPHICNFRHRYFWDGGLHCNTSDLHREGIMKDYFPERG